MTLDDLKAMNDGDLEELRLQITSLLSDRQEARRQQAIEAARNALAGVGLTFADVKEPARKRKPAAAAESQTTPATTGKRRGRPPKNRDQRANA